MGGTRTTLRVILASTLAFAASTSVANADSIVAGGDGLTPVVAGPLTFGNLCLNSTTQKPVALAIARNQGGSNVFKNGSSVALTAVSNSPRLTVAASVGSISIPGNWSSVAADTLSPALFASVTMAAGSTTGAFSSTVTYTAAGINSQPNNSNLTRTVNLTVTATVVVCDTTPPVVNVPAAITGEATSPAGRVVTFTTSATDASPASPAVTCTPASGSTFAIGTTTVNCSATDAAANVGTNAFTVEIVDTTPPAIAGTPTNITVEATGPSGASVNFTDPTATDIVDGSRPVTCVPTSGSTFGLGTNTVTCTASDSRTNTSTSSFTVTVSDTTAPVLVLPDPIVAEATGPNGAAVTFAALASDTVNGSSPVTCDPPSGSTFALGNTTVDCNASDASDNSTSGSFLVTVEDTTAPVVTVPASFSDEATDATGAAVTFSSSATDIVDGAVVTSCLPASGSTFALGTAVVTCSATDAAGNTGAASFNLTVVDATAPTLNLPADVMEEAVSGAGNVVSFSATATDLVDGSVIVNCSPASGSTFSVGTTTVVCSADDAAGNHVMGSFTVQITDTTDPMLSMPDDITAEATGPAGADVAFEAFADDIVDGTVTPECSPLSGSTFSLGVTTVSCTATDTHGNTDTQSFSIRVADTTPPVIEGTPTDFTVEAEGPLGATVTFTNPTATDLVDGAVAVTCVPPSESVFPLDVATAVVCTATDAHDNTATSTFEVLVSDTTAPVLSVPDDFTIEATSALGAVGEFDPTASDLVDGLVPVDCIPPSGSTFELGDTPVDCSATDDHGNSSDGSFTVTVEDTTAPELTVPGPTTVEATGPDGATVDYFVSASDIVDSDVSIVCDFPSGSTFAIGTTSVTCTATDDFGNTVMETFDVTVEDTTAPVLTVPLDITTEATGPDGANVSFVASAVDIVDGSVNPVCTPAASTVFVLGTTEVQCTATDAHGNIATGAFNVTVEDTTAPALTLPDDAIAEATSAAGASVNFEATAFDIVDEVLIVTCVPPSGSTFGLGETTVTCEATDQSGNLAEDTFTVTVVDTTGPAISDPSDVDAEATSAAGAMVTYDNPAAVDLVDGPVSVTCEPPSGSTFALDADNTVTCTATDAAGNTSTTTFSVTVEDRTAPVLTTPGDFSVEATGPTGAIVSFSTSASDVVDGSAPVACVPDSGQTLGLGSHTVSCSTTDDHGNTSSASFIVTVVDTTAPGVTVPAPINVEATGPAGATAAFSVSANDLVDGAVVATCSPVSGSVFPLGPTTVTCTAVDSHGNTGTGSFVVNVNDTTGPVLTLPANITVTATGPFSHDDDGDEDDGGHGHGHGFHVGYWYRGSFRSGHNHGTTTSFQAGAVVMFDATASDLVDGVRPVTCTPPSGSTFTIGTTTVNCSAIDAHGNTTNGSFTVTVNFDLRGLLSPVNPNAINVVKGGSTVPLKWQVLTPGAEYLSATSIVTSYSVVKFNCTTQAAMGTVTVPFTTDGATSLRYSRGDHQFVLNWQTPKMPGWCYRVEINFVGGQKLSANFQIK